MDWTFSVQCFFSRMLLRPQQWQMIWCPDLNEGFVERGLQFAEGWRLEPVSVLQGSLQVLLAVVREDRRSVIQELHNVLQYLQTNRVEHFECMFISK